MEGIDKCQSCGKPAVEYIRFYFKGRYAVWCLVCYTEELKKELIRQAGALKFRVGG